ncbi:MAG: hypothetical protein OXG84_15205 [Chloroflexi bacterium]|nr:hypothetical protein [Chloroflexota bacterium]
MNAARSDALTQALLDFKGKSTEALEGFAAAYRPDTSLVAELCDFAGGDDHNVQAAATWLLKRYGVTGAQLSPSQSEALLRLLIQETNWLSRIHVLQLMDTLVVPASLAAPLMDALAAQAGGDNKFIRAWSAHCAAVLADQHQEFRDRALDLLAEAGQDAAPSVQARLRRTRQQFDWI